MKNKISKSKKNKQRLQQRRRDWKHRGLTSQVENRCVDVFVCVCVCTFTVTRMAPVQLIFPLLQVKSFSFNHYNL